MSLTIISNISAFTSHGAPSDIILCTDSERTSGNLFYWKSSGISNQGTIYDGSMGVWEMMYEGPISIKWFGAVHSSTSDQQPAIQNAVNYATLKQAEIYVPEGKYYVERSVKIKQGLRGFYGPGTLFFNGPSNYTGNGVIDFDSVRIGGNDVYNCRLSIGEINANYIAKFCIFVSGANYDIHIHDTTCTGLNESNDTATYVGIQLHYGSHDNIVSDNIIHLPANASDVYSTAGINVVGYNNGLYAGVYFEYGGIPQYFDGQSYNNIVTDNTIYGGSHGIQLIGTKRSIISGNRCINQTARAIILGQACLDNLIKGNECVGFGSAGIHLAYCCAYNIL